MVSGAPVLMIWPATSTLMRSAERKHRLHVVLDQDDRIFLFQPREQLRHGRAVLASHPGHRLVEQQQFRLLRDRDREFELARLAVREVARRRVGARGETCRFDCFPRGDNQRRVAARRAPEAEGMAESGLHGERGMIEYGEIRHERGDLERARNPHSRTTMRRLRRDVAPVQADFAGVRTQQALQLRNERRLACAVRPDDRMAFAAFDRHRQVVGRTQAAEAFHQAFDRENRVSHARSPRV